MSIALSAATLGKINPEVSTPSYRHEQLTAGIIHIGVGNFHRAHQSMYMHQLFEMGVDHDWAIIGAGVKHYDEAMRVKLESQDWLSTIVELDPGKLTARVTGAMTDFIEINPQSIIDAMIQPCLLYTSPSPRD